MLDTKLLYKMNSGFISDWPNDGFISDGPISVLLLLLAYQWLHYMTGQSVDLFSGVFLQSTVLSEVGSKNCYKVLVHLHLLILGYYSLMIASLFF